MEDITKKSNKKEASKTITIVNKILASGVGIECSYLAYQYYLNNFSYKATLGGVAPVWFFPLLLLVPISPYIGKALGSKGDKKVKSVDDLQSILEELGENDAK